MRMRRRPAGEAELAALADGSVASDRRASLEAQVAASPALADRLAEQERAVGLLRGAGDEVEAPAGLRARLEAQRSPRTARTPRRLALAGVAVAAVAAVAIGVTVFRLRLARPALPGGPGGHRARSRSPRRRVADEDALRMADSPPRHRASAPRGHALLRGVAAEPGRRARPDRDVQRRPRRDALGGSLAGELQGADRHARAGRRQPGVIGREGPRRPGPAGLIRLTRRRRRPAARPAGGRDTGGSSPSPRESAEPEPSPCS